MGPEQLAKEQHQAGGINQNQNASATQTMQLGSNQQQFQVQNEQGLVPVYTDKKSVADRRMVIDRELTSIKTKLGEISKEKQEAEQEQKKLYDQIKQLLDNVGNPEDYSEVNKAAKELFLRYADCSQKIKDKAKDESLWKEQVDKYENEDYELFLKEGEFAYEEEKANRVTQENIDAMTESFKNKRTQYDNEQDETVKQTLRDELNKTAEKLYAAKMSQLEAKLTDRVRQLQGDFDPVKLRKANTDYLLEFIRTTETHMNSVDLSNTRNIELRWLVLNRGIEYSRLCNEEVLFNNIYKPSLKLEETITKYRSEKSKKGKEYSLEEEEKSVLMRRYLSIPFGEKETLEPKSIINDLETHLRNLEICGAIKKLKASGEWTDLEDESQAEALKKADRWADYYSNHVQTVLSDYGISLGAKKFSGEEALAVESSVQVQRWKTDTEAYRKIIQEERNAKFSITEKKKETEEKGKKSVDDNLIELEHKAHIYGQKRLNNFIATNTYKQYSQGEDIEKKLNSDGTEVVQYRSDIMSRTASFAHSRDTYNRLLQICRAFRNRFPRDSKENRNFEKIEEKMELAAKELMNVKKYALNDRRTVEIVRLGEMKAKLERMVIGSDSLDEKQCAGEMLAYLKKEQNGYLDTTERVNKNIKENDDEILKQLKIEDKQREKNTKKSKFQHKMIDATDIPLFSHEPTVSDVSQGELGDCYFLAALSGIVATNPQFIKQMMRDNEDGTVTVRFYAIDTQFRNRRSYNVTVKKTIPMRIYESNGTSLTPYAQGALWVKMVEKAYAAVRGRLLSYEVGRYDKRGQGYRNAESGLSEDAYRHILGETSKSEETKEKKLPTEAEEFRRIIGRKRDYFTEEAKNSRSVKERYMNGYRMIEYLVEKKMNENKDCIREIFSNRFMMYIDEAVDELIKLLENSDAIVDSKSIPSARSLENEDMKKMRSDLSSYWNACGRKKSALRATLDELRDKMKKRLEGQREQKEGEAFYTEYTDKEKQLYEKIENAFDSNKSVSIGVEKDMKMKFKNGEDGQSGESNIDGMLGGHEYTVLGTEKYVIDGQQMFFIRIRNPHATKYLYDKKYGLRRCGMKREGDEDQYQSDTQGIFLLELRDFYTVVHPTVAISDKVDGLKTKVKEKTIPRI